MPDNAQLLQFAIATPLVAALLIALGLPKRFSTKLAAAAFIVPLLIALWLWKDFPAEGAVAYQFRSSVNTGLAGYGIKLTLGLNGVSLPMFLLIPALLKRGIAFWPTLTAGCLLTMALYATMVWLGPRFGLRL